MSETPGQRSANTVLDLIDGAVDDYTSSDSMRWSPDLPPVKPDRPRLTHDGALPYVIIDETHVFNEAQMREAMERLGQVVSTWMQEVGRALTEWAHESMPVFAEIERAYCNEHRRTEPADPMERALYLRRNRNTGPAARQRAPKRIDPRRTR